MNRRKFVVGALVTLPGLLIASILAAAVAFHISNRPTGTIVSSGERRQYLPFIPTSYDSTRPTPLVISMHGAALWPAAQMYVSQWNSVAEQHGIVVVYPSGSGVPKIWRAVPGADVMADVRFISALIDTLQLAYNIDPARIYVDGLSNGAGMAFVLSCALSDRIAAVAAVAGAQALPWNWCSDLRPVPVIAFHGTADRFAPYRGGRSPISPTPFPSVPDWMASRAERNRCAPTPIEVSVSADVTRAEYFVCADSAAVVLYTVHGGGHSWPGGKHMPKWLVGTSTASVDATAEIWAFFREHPRARN